jgi:hypothetical protein
LPASLKQLHKAIDRVESEHQAACAATRKTSVQTTDARPDDADPDAVDAIGDGQDVGDELDRRGPRRRVVPLVVSCLRGTVRSIVPRERPRLAGPEEHPAIDERPTTRIGRSL